MNRNALLPAAICLSVWLPTSAHADDGDDLLRALGRCASLSDPTQRLACYDRLAPQVKAPAQTATIPPPPTKEEKESWFGLDNLFGGGEDKPQATPQQFGEERVEKTPEQAQEAKKEEIESITAHLTDYARNSFGKFIVFLDNGQVWAQLTADSGKAHFEQNPKENTVTIERAFLGSYSMTISGNTKLFKVRRLK